MTRVCDGLHTGVFPPLSFLVKVQVLGVAVSQRGLH